VAACTERNGKVVHVQRSEAEKSLRQRTEERGVNNAATATSTSANDEFGRLNPYGRRKSLQTKWRRTSHSTTGGNTSH
jgi:hypothetical protein